MTQREPSGAPRRASMGPGWILLAGLALTAVGQAFQETQPQPTSPSFATSDSNDDMIAVTGLDITGSSVLYLIDTKSRHLAVYQAVGGSSSSSVRLIGARNIDLDLQLDGYNDESEYSFKELEKKFAGR